MSTDLNRHEGYVKAWARANKGRKVKENSNRCGMIFGVVGAAVYFSDDEFGSGDKQRYDHRLIAFRDDFPGYAYCAYIRDLTFVDGKPAIAPMAVIERSERWPESVGKSGRFRSVGGNPEIFAVRAFEGSGGWPVESIDYVRFLDEGEAEKLQVVPRTFGLAAAGVLRFVDGTNHLRQAAKSANFSDALRANGMGPVAHEAEKHQVADSLAWRQAIEAMHHSDKALYVAADRALAFICGIRPREIADQRERESVVRQLMVALKPGKEGK